MAVKKWLFEGARRLSAGGRPEYAQHPRPGADPRLLAGLGVATGGGLMMAGGDAEAGVVKFPGNDSMLAKKAQLLVQARRREGMDPNTADAFTEQVLDPMYAPFRDYIEAEDLTYSQFNDRILRELQDEMGADQADSLLNMAIQLEDMPSAQPKSYLDLDDEALVRQLEQRIENNPGNTLPEKRQLELDRRELDAALGRLFPAGAGAAVGGGLMMAPGDVQAAMQGDSLLAAGNLVEDTWQMGKAGLQGLFGGASMDDMLATMSDTSLPRSEGGDTLSGMVGDAVSRGWGALMNYQPPLRDGATVGDDLQPIADWWGDQSEADRTRATAGGILASMLPGFPGRSTIRGAQRKAFPDVYGDPREIVDNVPVAPENPLMAELWGVTRADLADIADRQGNMDFQLPGTRPGSRGAKSAGPVMGPANTRRLVNLLEYARDTPMGVGMRGWYVGDPMQDRLYELTGSANEAAQRYDRLNNFSAMASPGSDVMTEINRGSFAHWLDAEGRFDDFMKYGNATSRPDDLKGLMGHPYHTTAHGKPMAKYREHGQIMSTAPKVPTYHRSFGTPETGFQTRLPVGDAHWSRGVGLSDTRTNKDFGKSASHPEMLSLGPWWADDVAAEVGLEGVPAQATLWGALSRATGVDSPVGSPKLELITDAIGNTARDRGMSPALVRDKFLMGEMPLDGRFRGNQGGFVDSNLLRLLGLGGGAAAAGWIASGDDEDEEDSELERKFKARKELLDSL